MRMPVLFVGHGSPMNAVEDNVWIREWERLGRELPHPKVILAISAHWFTRGTRVNDAEQPRMVYDMYGFPDELYQVRYPSPGAPELAESVRKLVGAEVQTDNAWGIDHGTWSVLCRMFPDADIPLTQLSVEQTMTSADRVRIGRALSPLREQGVLLVCSGNVVHNLRMVAWDREGGFPWADDFDAYIRDAVLAGRQQKVMDYAKHPSARLAVPTIDHYAPLLYALGAADKDTATVFNDARTLGGLSMTGFAFGL